VIKSNKLRGEELSCKARRGWNVLDLCCGSGAIGISLAKLAEDVKVTGSDLSADALAVAEQNAANIGAKSIRFVKSDMFEAFRGKLGNKKFDMIISNPPYIRHDVIAELEPEVRDHEPMMALDGTEDGLLFYRRIAHEAKDWLNPGGSIYLEIGHDQGDAVSGLLKEAGFDNIRVVKDLPGLDRVVCADLP